MKQIDQTAGATSLRGIVQVYKDLGQPLLENLLQGFNICLLAYGQTGSGKTHTMSGPVNATASTAHAERGIAPRFMGELVARRMQLEAKGMM